MENTIAKFEVGTSYYYRFISSYDTIVRCTITKRTAKTITFKDDCEETFNRRIYVYDNSECVDIGHYSMAPTLRAENTAEKLDQKKAEAEAKKAEEEAREEAEREEAHKTTKKIVESALSLYMTMYPIESGKPFVEIGCSEMIGLPGCGESIVTSVKAANAIFAALDIWQHAIRETSEFYGWYHKTNFTIHYIDEKGEEASYSGRYDIGDGEGGLLNHIHNFGEWHRTHEEFGAEKKNPPETNEILEFVKMLKTA